MEYFHYHSHAYTIISIIALNSGYLAHLSHSLTWAEGSPIGHYRSRDYSCRSPLERHRKQLFIPLEEARNSHVPSEASERLLVGNIFVHQVAGNIQKKIPNLGANGSDNAYARRLHQLHRTLSMPWRMAQFNDGASHSLTPTIDDPIRLAHYHNKAGPNLGCDAAQGL